MTVSWPSLSLDGSVVPALSCDEAASGALFLVSTQGGTVVEASEFSKAFLPTARV